MHRAESAGGSFSWIGGFSMDFAGFVKMVLIPSAPVHTGRIDARSASSSPRPKRESRTSQNHPLIMMMTIHTSHRISLECKRLNAFGMAGAISKFSSSRAGSYPFRFLCVLFLCATPVQKADAALKILEYSGTFQVFDDVDFLGIDGAGFQVRLTYDSTKVRSITINANTDIWILDEQPGSSLSLTIFGSSNKDGTYQTVLSPIVRERINVGLNDTLDFNDMGFDIDGIEFIPSSSFRLPEGFTGAISPTNTISAISTSDVLNRDSLLWQAYDDETGSFAEYLVESATISTIPEPTSAILLAISATAFILRRERIYRQHADQRVVDHPVPKGCGGHAA